LRSDRVNGVEEGLVLVDETMLKKAIPISRWLIPVTTELGGVSHLLIIGLMKSNGKTGRAPTCSQDDDNSNGCSVIA
jgi:hypothetical protein